MNRRRTAVALLSAAAFAGALAGIAHGAPWHVQPNANSWSMPARTAVHPAANSWSLTPAANSWSLTPAANSWSAVADHLDT